MSGLGDLPLIEVVAGALAVAGLFVLFGLRRPAERAGRCQGCPGGCGDCALEGEAAADRVATREASDG